jgi:hypothetical protein
MYSHQSFSLTNLTVAKPSQNKLLALALLVLIIHVWLLMNGGDSLWRLHSESQKLGPLQTRVITPVTLPSLPAHPKAGQPQQPTPKPPPALASNTMATPAGMSAVASAALPEPVSPTEDSRQLAQEVIPMASPPVAATEAPASLPEKTAELPEQQKPQDNALVAKAGNFPENIQINYKLSGQERGLNYYASGFLKWQVKPANSSPRNYEAELSVRAFFIGSRIWRSQGVLSDDGLAPKRYSDTWRSERAAHFDSDSRKITFSGNTPSAPLQAGAQDQVSLFIQMAAAVAAQNFKTGAELNIQTATSRDAVNWRLTYKSDESIEVKGERLETQRWVCLPRGKYDSQIEMWLSKSHGGLPVRIKMTQVNGNFIDMEMNNTEALGPLVN